MYYIICFILYLGIFVKPCFLCKYLNNTCYKYFFSVNDPDAYQLRNDSDFVDLQTKRRENTTGCLEPGQVKQCSGHGQCRNGTCECHSLEPLGNETESLYEYSGRFCEECPYCKGQRCKKVHSCVECIVRNISCTNECFLYYNFVEKLTKNSYNEKICEMEDKDNCFIKFKYFYRHNNELFVDIESDIRCINGRKYLLICCYIFLGYIFLLMVISKCCLNGVYDVT